MPLFFGCTSAATKSEKASAPFEELTHDNGRRHESAPLLKGIPTGKGHHEERLEQNAEGTLYATIGVASSPELAQDLGAAKGKILKLNTSNEDEPNMIGEDHNYGWPNI